MNLSICPDDLRAIAAAVADELERRAADNRRLPDDSLGVPEPKAAAMLGIKPHVLRDARRRGEISGRRVGRSVVYEKAALVAWLRDGHE